jgi:hypothetical protein
MAEQLSDGDELTPRIIDRELRQLPANRLVEVDPTGVDQLQRPSGRRPHRS